MAAAGPTLAQHGTHCPVEHSTGLRGEQLQNSDQVPRLGGRGIKHKNIKRLGDVMTFIYFNGIILEYEQNISQNYDKS